MLGSLCFKEWLKIRWTYISMMVLSLLILGYIFLTLAHDLRFVNAPSFWTQVIFMGYNFYSIFTYFPLVAGVALAVAQFVPEIHSNRLKLTLHLPVKENTLLFQMITLGLFSLLLLYVVSLFLLLIVSSFFFPWQILSSIIFTTAPWYLSGIAAYFGLAMIIIEPSWIKRILYAAIIYGLVHCFYAARFYNQYQQSLPYFLLLIFLPYIGLFYTGIRFRKGVRSQ
ncbi:hypothetical protein B1H10_01735 [candidate division KSB1 bacterium 4484_188]|nr:MAG: hypothetical protein B1H10_01735 [candidate division KSB1 bacterium 4484_188]HFE63231.1 hypothetical protein [Caldithrix sp.]